MSETLQWTDEGRAALAAEKPLIARLTAKDDKLRAKVDKTRDKFADTWQRGLERGDDVGARAVELAADPLAFSSWTDEELASVLALFGARGSGDARPLFELARRARGLTALLPVVVQLWAHKSNSSNHAVWLMRCDDERMDASVSYAKGDLTRYAAACHLEEPAVLDDALYDSAPFSGQLAIAFVARDQVRLRALSERWETVPHFARTWLYSAIDDETLLMALCDDIRVPLSFALLDRFGLGVFELYAREIGSRIHKSQRAPLLEQLANVRGPRAAKIIAGYAEKAPYTKIVRAYFARHPELLVPLLNDDEMDRVKLEKLRAKI